MTTTVGPASTVTENTRLQDLVDQIPGQLRSLAVGDGMTGVTMIVTLRRLTDRVACEPVGQAIGRPAVQRYLASREREALDMVALRTAPSRVAASKQQAWLTSRTERVEMLAVEEDLFYPRPPGSALTDTRSP